jgi:hypothetical protein
LTDYRQNLRRKHLSRVARINRRPVITHQDQSRRAGEGKQREQEAEQQARGKRLLLRYSGRVDHADNRNILGLIDTSQFILLREQLKDCLLYLHAAIEVRIGNGKPGKLAQGRIEFALIVAATGSGAVIRSCAYGQRGGRPCHFRELGLQAGNTSLGLAYPDIAIAINLAQRLEARLFDEQLRLHARTGIDHGAGLLLNVDGAGLARELA